MKNILIVAIALVSGVAYARPDTTKMTCRDATALVANSGAVVLTTGPFLYDRFVANRSFCGTGETTVDAFVTTLDNDNCKIGFTCKEIDHEGGNSISRKYPAAVTVCKEGATRQDSAKSYYPNRPISERDESITVVCNSAGKWVPVNDLDWKLPKTVGRVCKDGALAYYPQPDKRNMFGVTTYVCKSGRWYFKSKN